MGLHETKYALVPSSLVVRHLTESWVKEQSLAISIKNDTIILVNAAISIMMLTSWGNLGK
jgi:hypothetical protein